MSTRAYGLPLLDASKSILGSCATLYLKQLILDLDIDVFFILEPYTLRYRLYPWGIFIYEGP
jgi:hypothetical protein